jgi:hypothetical protein
MKTAPVVCLGILLASLLMFSQNASALPDVTIVDAGGARYISKVFYSSHAAKVKKNSNTKRTVEITGAKPETLIFWCPGGAFLGIRINNKPMKDGATEKGTNLNIIANCYTEEADIAPDEERN